MQKMRLTTILISLSALTMPAVANPSGPDQIRDRIRDLAQAVPFEAINASPRNDIQTHIEMMSLRGSGSEAFAVPDLDLDLIASGSWGTDILMDTRVLDAISRMPPDRATQVLRLIEDRRSGVAPLPGIPSLSGRGPETVAGEPQTLALRGWVLDRDMSGAPFIQNGTDIASRIMILPSMILGDLGRVISVQDDATAFRVTLESGDTLEGAINHNLSEIAEIADEDTAEVGSGDTSQVAVDPSSSQLSARTSQTAPTRSLRPRQRPEGLATPVAATPAETPVVTQAPPIASQAGQGVTRPRSRPEPAGSGDALQAEAGGADAG
jgi:hypothetical protein